MLVHSLWDQEDIYGAIAVYKAIKPKDTANDKVFLVLGPWHHGQEIDDGSTLGAISSTATRRSTFRAERPAAVPRPVPEGRRAARPTSRRSPPSRPARTRGGACRRGRSGCASGCAVKPTPLYLRAGPKLGFARLRAAASGVRRVRLRSGQARALPRAPGQHATAAADLGRLAGRRSARGVGPHRRRRLHLRRADRAPVKISGQPVANLVASTSGTDSDWVVKLIDVYPDEVAGEPEMGGYQLDGLGGHLPRPLPRELRDGQADRGRTSRCSTASRCPTANHVFLPGPPHHGAGAVELVPALRPQPADLRAEHLLGQAGGLPKAATQRVYHAPDQASFIELPVVTAP